MGAACSGHGLTLVTTYLLGAGFSLTANAYAKPEDAGLCGPYPTSDELAQWCFDGSYQLANGVEAAFQDAIKRRDHLPVRRLANLIHGADNCPGQRAAAAESSCLRRFLTERPAETYLTFNYDGLVELGLMRGGRWVPMDGFGITAEVETYPKTAGRLAERSEAVVLHLHGSLYLYPREFDVSDSDGDGIQWLSERPQVDGVFDPDPNVGLFIPFRRGSQDLRYRIPEERFIAPVPDKAEDLAGAYVNTVYKLALRRVAASDRLVAIGYRFGQTDQASYDPILTSVASHQVGLTVVAPDADSTVNRIEFDYGVKGESVPLTFDEWVLAGYPGHPPSQVSN